MIKNITPVRLRLSFGIFAFIGLAILFSSCKKETPGGAIKPKPAGSPETEVQLSQLAGDLLNMEEKISQEPQNVEWRLKLLAAAMDTVKRKVYSVGIGKIPTEAPNPAIAEQAAERAAFIDGCRWIAYILAWKNDSTTPDFGHIQGNVPPAKMIYKNTAPDQIVVVVEAEI